MTVASPLARQYYFMWLFFPMTVLMHRAAYDPRPAVRAGTWGLLGVAGGLMCLSLPVFPNDLQAYGNNLAATVVHRGGAGLAYAASACRRRRRCLASGDERATTWRQITTPAARERT